VIGHLHGGKTSKSINDIVGGSVTRGVCEALSTHWCQRMGLYNTAAMVHNQSEQAISDNTFLNHYLKKKYDDVRLRNILPKESDLCSLPAIVRGI